MPSVVYNEAAMEKVRADNEAAMNAQITQMKTTMEQYKAQAEKLVSEAANLESQAAAQDRIAATRDEDRILLRLERSQVLQKRT